jgi:hypothetical protein
VFILLDVLFASDTQNYDKQISEGKQPLISLHWYWIKTDFSRIVDGCDTSNTVMIDWNVDCREKRNQAVRCLSVKMSRDCVMSPITFFLSP